MFFDLNIVYDGVKEQPRREMVGMAMQMGYSGIVSNHVVAGLMSDSDRCRISPLPLTAIVSASPNVAKVAKFHQEVLGVTLGQPFRQYSRLTVIIEDQVQAAALNAGNPVLRTYDLVAVQPTNQKMFGQACTHLEVDLISLNFTEKQTFRLKLPFIKAAIERGIYFEISYGAALTDVRARRELFTNIKMLVGWTRGKNIVVSSGARQAMELRGPNDVANLATMFGLTRERAKAAISKNCKSALLHGLTRRKAYKAAIIVDRVRPEPGAEKLWFDVPNIWDPLSTEGDCILPEEDANQIREDDSAKADQLTLDMHILSGETNFVKVSSMRANTVSNDLTPNLAQKEKIRRGVQKKHNEKLAPVRSSPRTNARKRARK